MKRPALSIRARTSLTATVVVGVALVVACVALIYALPLAMRSSIQAAAATRASDIALLAASGSLPSSIPGQGDAFVAQVVSGGRVVARSPDLQGQPAVSNLVLAPGRTRLFTLRRLPENEASRDSIVEVEPPSPLLVVARGVATPHGPSTVFVAASLSPMEETSEALVPIVLIGAPIMLLVVAFTTSALTNSALRPVRAITDRAATISSSAPGERLPVPLSQDEIRSLAETMNDMLDRIESAGVMQRRFTADASHELKSPIATIRTMLEVARADPARVEMPSLLDDLLAEDRRLELLVADLLLVGQVDERALRLHRVPLDLPAIVKEEAVSARRGGDLIVDTSGVFDVALVADEARVRQLLRNLLDNALRHARERVWVEARTDGGDVVLTVSDDGSGIPASAREHVFERFVRLDDGRGRADGGTGLGLSVCRAIALAHGGSIRVQERAEGGAALETRLPLAAEQYSH